MVEYFSTPTEIMTLAKSGNEDLSQEEWNELVALKKAINSNPASVHPEKMELFTELLVRSLAGKGDVPEKEPSTAVLVSP
jgi:hypothetical protein